MQCPLPESNQGHGDFQSLPDAGEVPAEVAEPPGRWAANGSPEVLAFRAAARRWLTREAA
ncbi:MAG: hypothetical protein JWP97_2525 [Labilithrix sp.]|nr:hypothetical protein [Labilithrix sp.]